LADPNTIVLGCESNCDSADISNRTTSLESALQAACFVIEALQATTRDGLAMKKIIVVIGLLFCIGLSGSPGIAQERLALTVNQLSDLLKGRVSSTRIAQLVEQQGVNFELTEPILRRLKTDGANEAILAAVKKMAARFAEEQRRRQTDEGGRQKSPEADKRGDSTAQRVDEIRRQLQENARRPDEQKKIGTEQGAQVATKKNEPVESKAKAETLQKSPRGGTAALMLQEDVGRVVSLRAVTASEKGEIAGALVNNAAQTLRDVQLQIVYSWRWKNEFQPGKDDPGTARYFTLNQEISPGQTASFDYKPSPPLASRTDGEFDITVKVVGFAQVFQPAAR
jgi:hypothetical protein